MLHSNISGGMAAPDFQPDAPRNRRLLAALHKGNAVSSSIGTATYPKAKQPVSAPHICIYQFVGILARAPCACSLPWIYAGRVAHKPSVCGLRSYGDYR